MTGITYRDAVASDAADLGAVHVASWRESYAGLLPALVLRDLSVQARAAMWQTVLDDPASAGDTAIVMASDGARLIGFGTCGRQRDAPLQERGFEGEVGAIYVLQQYKRAGVGRTMMRLLAGRLLEKGLTAMSLWVLEENAPARRFYEALGGVPIAERRQREAGVLLCEVAYGWTDLVVLTAGDEANRSEHSH